MNFWQRIKAWWDRKNKEADAKVIVHFRLSSGRTFDVEAIDPKRVKK